MHRIGFTVLAVALAGLLSGCFSWVSGIVGVRGEVVFADTGLGVRSRGEVAGQTFQTREDGRLALSVRAGVHDYTVTTLMGTDRGKVTYSGTGPLRVTVPAFSGWSRALFDELLIDERAGVTKRWEYGKTVKVWIQTVPHHNGAGVAKEVLRQWESLLNLHAPPQHPALRFEFVASPYNADMTVTFHEVVEYVDPTSGKILRPDGYCALHWNPLTGRIEKADVQIRHAHAGSYGLLRHEIGHCLGLGHSTNPNHLMYPTVSSNKNITTVETYYVRLLYSIGRSQALAGARPSALPEDHVVRIEYLPDGSIRQIIPDWVEDAL